MDTTIPYIVRSTSVKGFISDSLIPFAMCSPKYKEDVKGISAILQADITCTFAIDQIIEELPIGQDFLQYFRLLECGCITFSQLSCELEASNFIIKDILFQSGEYLVMMGDHEIIVPHYLF